MAGTNKKILDLTGTEYLWNKIKTALNSKADASDLETLATSVPTATTSKSGTTTTLTVTDKNGTTTTQILDGAKGDTGDSGVYVGNTQPTGDENIWINPNGTPDNIIPNNIKAALLACFENVAWINDQGKTYYDALYNALYPERSLYQALTLNDFIDTRGFSDFSVTDEGSTSYSGALQFSVAALDVGVNSVIADTSTTTNPRGTWLIFCKIDANTYYITDGGSTPKLFVFTYDSDTQKFTATEDNTIADIELGEGYNYSPAQTKIDLVDNELLLYDNETDKLIYKITNANCLGFWAHTYYGVPVWRNAKVKYNMRIPTLSDFVETRTVPELQIDSSGTVTCGSTKSYWLFTLKSGITSMKFHRVASVSGKVAAWIVYKKVDDNTYYCTDGNERFRFEYDSTNNKFTATNISSETQIQVLYGDDKKYTYRNSGMYVTAQLENNSLKVLSSYGYCFVIPDANCLGYWGISANTLNSFRVGGDI